ncbi:glutaminase A [Rhodococcus sp. PAMC28707]|uniref:glutaminase A n=1 Tax=unclassified Rhodococcus (in: high G+C Gram-positive bacteria) TaxID=192944 RepID=UPI00109DC134|nr:MULTISPECIES: glutaminase A [unclassified Rhodococcus (in: high G+C Gram-positive bacteria)]QCB50994.1 glutaminase A [Rhodococcus sp. PAMC28705]QCB57313.1 glutaminase A [Rhodococcus sp. PAMC28707]
MTTVVDQILKDVFEACRDNTSGAVADYIPELAAVAPDGYGIALATSDGYVYEIGETATPFTIQSISKPFTYALALTDRGEAAVARKIDIEPSGEPFNEISLDPITERPRNPMINAGAITSASLIKGRTREHRFERIRAAYSRYAGRELTFNESVYASEARTGNRNRAIGYMLRSFDIIEEDPDAAVDLYFRQCSIDVTAADLAMMAATMANNGVNPRTRERALAPALVERVLSVMTTCGMYDGAGDWVARVGMPAKSGVGGGLLAVLPGQMGIAVYSPRLDQHGSSVRGVATCRELSTRLELHFLHVTRAARSAIRARYTLTEVPSRKRRSDIEQDALAEFGTRARVYELHGDLLFSGAETAVREIGNLDDKLDALVIDARGVGEVSDVARSMFDALHGHLAERGCQASLVDPHGVMGHKVSSIDPNAGAGRVFSDAGSAIRWAEELLLDRYCAGPRQPETISISEHPVLSGLTPAQHKQVEALIDIREYPRGRVIVRGGDSASGLFLVLAGEVSSIFVADDGSRHRITTLSPGMSFGEMPLLAGTSFILDFCADTPLTVGVLSVADFDALTKNAPDVKLELLTNLATGAYLQMNTAIKSLGQFETRR